MSVQSIKPEHLYDYRLAGEPSVHPYANKLAYSLKEIDREGNDYLTSIRIAALDGSGDKPVAGGGKDASPQWSPDGSQLAFLRTAEGGRQIWVADAEGAGARRLTEAKRGVTSFAWSPDSRRVVYTSRAEAEPAPVPAEPAASRGRSYERTIPKAEGSGWWDGLYSHLFVIRLDGDAALQLTKGAFNAAQPIWSPVGEEIAFLAKYFEHPHLDSDLVPFNDIFTVQLANGTMERRTISTLNISQFAYAPNGASFALIAEDRSFGSGTQNRLYTLAASGGAPVPLSPETRHQLGNFILNDVKAGVAMPGPVFSPDGDAVLAIASLEGQAHIYRFVQDENPVAVTTGERDIHQFAASPDGSWLVAAAMGVDAPGELVGIQTATGAERRLTAWNDAAMAGAEVSVPEPFWFESEDGYRIQGWIMKPGQLAPGQKVPLVLQIHGGPHAMYGPAYSHEFQTLAARGYAVLFTNPRGSFGYGQAFAKACRGDFGGGDYQDVMMAVDAALERFSFIDASRLAVAGGSYGGLMTNWIVAHSDRFRAAVSHRCISNWMSFYGMSDIGISYTEGIIGGNPWDQPGLLWEKSPLAHAKNVQTPLLLLHGEQDFRCPVGQSDQMYTALKRLGKTTRLVRYPGSNHSFMKAGKPSYRVDALEQISSWLTVYLEEEGTHE